MTIHTSVPLQKHFKAPAPGARCIPHELEPGNSMLVSYPGSSLGRSVFMLAHISQDEYMAFQVNGPRHTTLRDVMKETIDRDIAAEEDMPVFHGGAMEKSRMFIITPHDWHPEWPIIPAGPYAVHATLNALHAIADGDRPDRMAMVSGYVQGQYTDFVNALQDNMLGEIAADDDLIFRPYDTETKWARAMYLHTGGKSLTIPSFYQGHSLVDLPDQPPEAPPRYIM